MAAPEDRLSPELAPSLCSAEMLPYRLTDFFLEWLRFRFADPGGLLNPQLRTLRWTKEAATTQIQLKPITDWDPKQTEKRPAVIIQAQDYQEQRYAVNSEHLGWFDLTGSQRHATLWAGSHTLFCVSPVPRQAEYLAGEVATDLVHFGPVIRHTLNLHRFGPFAMGKAFKLEQARETVVVPVTGQVAYESAWRLIPQAPVLKHVQMLYQSAPE